MDKLKIPSLVAVFFSLIPPTKVAFSATVDSKENLPITLELHRIGTYSEREKFSKENNLFSISSIGLSFLSDRGIVSPGKKIAGEGNVSERQEAERFKFGEFLIVCFRVRETMKVRLLDLAPSGRSQQIFPGGVNSVEVNPRGTYCLGDDKSSMALQLDEESGVGLGKIYILGASDGEPSITPRRYSIPGVTSGTGDAATKRFESWHQYDVSK
ncbi:MAG: hypothetical protein AAF720_01465 [Pseudomonadota bacterium]